MVSVALPSVFKWQLLFSVKFHRHFRFSHTCAPFLGHHHPPGAAIPPHQLATPPYPSPSTLLGFSVPHTTPPPPQMTSRSTFVHTRTHAPIFGPTTPQSHQLSTFLGIFGVPPSHYPLPCRFLSTFCSPWLGSCYNTFLWGAHATRTACLPHSNHFFAGLCWHSVHPRLRSHYNTHWLGAILLALYAHPTSTTPANFILALHSSTAGELVKTPSMLPFGDTLAFLGPTLTIPWPVDGEVSFWANPCVQPLRPMRARP